MKFNFPKNEIDRVVFCAVFRQVVANSLCFSIKYYKKSAFARVLLVYRLFLDGNFLVTMYSVGYSEIALYEKVRVSLQVDQAFVYS